MNSAKVPVFILEGLNALATTYHFFYIYFFAAAKFDFDKGQNLLLATGLGLAYAAASVMGGRLAQRRGYLNALGLGCVLMGLGQLVAAGTDNLFLHAAVALLAVTGMGMTWPALEALACEGETGRRLQTMLGIYNLVWSLGGAFAYLTGGAMIESWGLRSIFLLPAFLNLLQVLIIWRVRRRPGTIPRGDVAIATHATGPMDGAQASTQEARCFLRMAWFTNPLAYLTINTVVALAPSLADTLALSPRYAGYYCSVWMFMRTGAFLWLWFWPGWHYRFGWLLAAYLGMLATFVLILLSPTVPMLVAAQVGFGLCIGLIYYSSLYYSMDAGEAKGEHGGIHEAAIGLGSAAGPAIGAAALYFAPQVQHGTAKAVGLLLALGFCGLLWLRRR
jgi:MFS family permease